ncbi:MAG TPA: FAD binding domain-containing protein [Stellaceae bacterium]|nr:FAD binding domain-containing protein [Stellaceae bacterium]
MKAAAFDYVAPQTVAAALDALDAEGEARILAGGQSLAPLLNLRLATPKRLVDIGRIAALRRIEDRGDHHRIGAMVTHAAIEDGGMALADHGMLAHVAAGIAYRAVRNRGTIGGSLAHADPSGDWPSALMALDARAVAAGRAGEREIAIRDFLRGAFATALEPGEMLTAILLPKLSAAARWGYYKIVRKAGEFPEAIGAALFDSERRRARIVIGALGSAPLPLDNLAARAAEKGIEAVALDAVEAALREAAPDLDRIALRHHAVAARRAILEALAP